MNSKTIVNERTGFEVYLEGVKAPPASIRISENEGGFPTASVSFPATSAMLRILPETKVQIFGKDPLTGKQIILFEGEVSSVGYQKSGGSRSVSLSCNSMLDKWRKVTARPLDAMVTPRYREASGDLIFNATNLTPDERSEGIQKTKEDVQLATSLVNKRTKQEVSGELKDLLEEINLTNFAGFSSEILQILQSDDVDAGDLDILVQYFLRKFEMFDPFYGMESSTYGISDSVCTWPNFGKMDPFKSKAAMDGFFKMSTQLGETFQNSGSLVLIQALRAILETLHFNLLSPASFTSSRKFWGSGNRDEEGPVRAYFTPNLENSPPAKFNLFFPHQVMSFSYSRNFENEPTRTIGKVELGYLKSGANMEGATAFLTEPGLNITQKGVERNSVGFTPEETYRGINVNHASFDSFFSEAREDHVDEKKAMDEAGKEDYFEKVKPGLTQLTINSHLVGRMSGRSVSFQTTWSPYRMTGVPGAYIEEGDGPSITGVISSITTNITANGNATSTITFRSPRFIYKEDDIEDDEGMINDFTLDPYLDINTFLFDENVYDFNNIGGSLYSYLKHGKFSTKNRALEEYAKNPIGHDSEEEEADEEAHQPFEGRTELIEKMFEDKNLVNEDSSIIDFIRGDSGEPENYLAPDAKLTKVEGYTRNVYEAIYKVTDLYKNIEGQGALIDKWTNNLTYRNLTTKGEYFATLGVQDPESLENSKDGIKLFTGTERIEAIKDANDSHLSNKPIEELDRRGLTRRRKSLRKRYVDLQKSLLTLKEIEGELNEPNNRAIIAFEAQRLRAKPYSLDIPLFKQEEFEDIPVNEFLKEVREKAVIKAREYENTIDDIDNRLTQSVWQVPDSEENTDPGIELLDTIPEGFEYELFKPYNLTRRKHVGAALNRYVRNSSKALREDDSGSDIRQNINILE